MPDEELGKSTSRSANLVAIAEERHRSLNIWAEVNWNLHNWFVSLSLVGAFIVPFGVAALPYLEKSYERPANLALFFISAISLILQFLNIRLRLAQRAVRSRQLRDKFAIAIADFKDDTMPRIEFKAIVQEVLESRAMEESA